MRVTPGRLWTTLEPRTSNLVIELDLRIVRQNRPHTRHPRPNYVDAYYGPPEWRAEAERTRPSLSEIRARATALTTRLRGVTLAGADEIGRLRHAYLTRQLDALVARVDMLGGKRLSFDEEARALYDVLVPRDAEEHFQRILDDLGVMLPGDGSLAERYERFRAQLVIPREKLDTVFRTAIAECKRRTERYIALPPGESFRVEYVTGKSWSGYNWYQGSYRSLIQVNVDLPVYIGRAVDLACHEGYPGHHVYNAPIEHHLMRGRGWREFSVYPLFSPQPARWARSGAGRRVLPRAGARAATQLCGQRGRAAVPER